MSHRSWESGTRYGAFMTTGKSYYVKEKKKRHVEVICDCGTIKWVRFDTLNDKHEHSCGCLHLEWLKGDNKPAQTHGYSSHPLYTVYKKMMERCYDKKHKGYHSYGGRGVCVTEIWKLDFMSFFNWALPLWREGLELDKDIKYCKVHGGERGNIYSPDYCQFITPKENKRHTSLTHFIEYNGEKKSLVEWSEIIGISDKALGERLNRYGWSIEKSLTTPHSSNRKSKKAVNVLACD